MRVTLQSISIRGHQQRTTPDQHIAYRVDSQDVAGRTSSVWRRYSEFVDLDGELSRETGLKPPKALPPRHRGIGKLWSRPPTDDETVIAERRIGLEDYLRSLLAHKDPRWRESAAFAAFMAIPIASTSRLATDFTSSTWLDEQDALLTLSREIRSDLNRRDALQAQGDAASRHVSASAKAKLAGLLTRLTTLTASLDRLAAGGMAEGELRRRSDMVARLQDEAETLGRLAVASRSAAVAGSAARAQTVASSQQDLATAAGRAALLGDKAPLSHVTTSRVLGGRKKGEETAETRGLDEHGLLQMQQQQLSDQDSRIEALAAVVRRQRELGIAIGQELEMHNELLDGLSADVDTTNDRLTGAKGQLKRLGG